MSYILTIIFTLLSAYYDAKQLKSGGYFNDHTLRVLFRIVVLSLIALFFGIHILTLLSIFYLLFDISLNLMWGKKWNYIGEVSKIDRYFISKGGWIPQYITKITLVILTITFLN